MATHELRLTMDPADIDIPLREVDEDIIAMLETMPCTRQHLSTELDYSGEYIYQRVTRLIEHGVVEKIHDGFYRLAADGGTVVEREADVEPDAPTREDADDAIDAALAGWEHGRDADERAASRQVAEESLRWLRERGRSARKADVPLAELAASDPRDRSPETLWTEVVRAAWGHAVENGVVEKPNSWSYDWVGEE